MKSGSLSRVDQFLASDAPSSVFTLHHWSSDSKDTQARPRRLNYRHCSRSRFESMNNIYNNHARHVLIKIQESALNFLVRWCLLDESYRLQKINLKHVKQSKGAKRRQSNAQSGSNLSQSIGRNQDELKGGNSRLLLRDVTRLRERNLATFFRYLFWRWFTPVNAIELALISLLASCCAYQCYELLEDYFNYPTHVIVSSVLNDNFRDDLPGLTICDNNRISVESLRRNYADLNTTHFLAMSRGGFYSINNFSLTATPRKGNYTPPSAWYGIDSSIPPTDIHSDKRHESSNTTNTLNGTSVDGDSGSGESISEPLDESSINWVKVARVLSKFRPAGHFSVLPSHSIVDSLVCATIGGERVTCDKMREITSLQEAALCRTLFHDSVMWDKSTTSVRELEQNLKPEKIVFGKIGATSGSSLVEFDDELNNREHHDELNDERSNEGRLRVEMENMEIVRVRINFHSHDYANPRGLVGARLAIHSSSSLGEIVHVSYRIEPGNWYTYYIERSDHQRLPPPYSTKCYAYQSNRNDWQLHTQDLAKTFKYKHKLMMEQANTPERMLPEYAQFLRSRAMGRVSRLTSFV